MEQKNVLLINDSFPPQIDGVANAVMNYAQIISQTYGQAVVVTPDVPNADDSPFPYSVIHYPSIDMTKRFGYYAGLPFSAKTVQKLMDNRCDLIHAHCPITSLLLARSLREIIDVPLLFTYHTKFDIEISNLFRNKALQKEATRLICANISSCDEVWTVSHGAGENLRSLGYEGEYRIMPNGVDFPKGRIDEAAVRAVTENYDLPEDVPVFLFVGRMMWYKGLRIILDALSVLKKQKQDFRMIFVGNGADRDDCICYCHELDLDDRVFFVSPVFDRAVIRAWYCAADLFLFPSSFDTNGLVVREAAACALASVLIRGSCASENICDDQNGFLIEESAQSMADKLLWLCKNPEKMKTVGQNAQEQIYLSWEDAIALANERYDCVIRDYRAGKYPEHTKPGDDAFRAVGNYLEAIATIREHFESIHDRFI